MEIARVMKSDHDISANYGILSMTLNGRRLNVAMAKHVELKASVESREVKKIGTNLMGRKSGLMSYSGQMTLFKCMEEFDKMIAEYDRTGIMPRFDLQLYTEDPAAADLGRSIKQANNCIIDGDILLGLIDAEGGSIEQEVNFYAESVEVPEYLKNPDYM